MTDRDSLNHCTNKLIELANNLREEGNEVQLVSAALMAASGIYATFTAAGNNGALEPSGVEKVVSVYRQNLEHIQARKKAELAARGESPPETQNT